MPVIELTTRSCRTGAKRQRLWPEVVRAYRGYAAYQRKTRRRIPLVILEPLARAT